MAREKRPTAWAALKTISDGPDIWMNLEKNYELRLAAQAIGAALQKIPQPHERAGRATIRIWSR
jgi:plasmid maintenance system antidote protein VapI